METILAKLLEYYLSFEPYFFLNILLSPSSYLFLSFNDITYIILNTIHEHNATIILKAKVLLP